MTAPIRVHEKTLAAITGGCPSLDQFYARDFGILLPAPVHFACVA
jgi:hypothetical protein